MTSEREYVVEAIVGKRLRRGKAQYLIKWKECDESENTWEPAANLNCQALLDQFEEVEKEGLRRQVKRSSSGGDANGNPSPQPGPGDVEKKAKRESLPRGAKVAAAEGATPPTAAKPKSKGKNGFEKGHVVQELKGVTEDGGQLYFLVEWKDVKELELVPSKVVRQHEPEMVIDFYENRIIWNTAKKEAEEQKSSN